MPNCRGLSVSVCESAIDSAAIAAYGAVSFTVNTASSAEVDFTIGPDLAIRTSPASDSSGHPEAVTLIKNPDPLPIGTLLSRYAPELHYDSQESYAADSAAEITDNYVSGEYTNLLKDADDIVLAAADPADTSPTLNLSYLGSYLGAQSTDRLVESHGGGSYLDDASRLHGAGYGDRMYARFKVDGFAWLQYWFFYYYNPKTFAGGVYGNHEGDWEMVQIAIDDQQQPVLAAYSQHEQGESCFWSDVATNADGHPVVHVAEGSHANYFLPGIYDVFWSGIDVGDDVSDGWGPVVTPTIVDVTTQPTWITWPGNWGNSSNSPASLPAHESWAQPLIWQVGGTQTCRQQAGFRLGRIDGRLRIARVTTPPAPVVRASIRRHRAVINYVFKSFPKDARKPWTLLTTVVPSGHRYMPYTVRTHIGGRSGQIIQKLGYGAGPYTLRVSALSRAGERSRVVTLPLK